ncbi:putative phosphotransferase [Ranavirus ambystoma1]|uniref:Putative phosphotransferase n=1 Tax=Ranavirus ambystoma1 TaxID=265294 RepID=A0A0U2HZY0_9VIRU|nr:putative phosphotransferase [Ambystoma tigrinum virus]
MAMVSNVKYFADALQGTQGKVGTFTVLGENVFFKRGDGTDTVCGLEMVAGRILRARSDVHFCEPKYFVEMDDGEKVCSFELLNCKPLGSMAPGRKGKKSVGSVTQYLSGLYQTFAAAAAAHSVGVVHADLHTGNVMLCPEPVSHYVYNLGGGEMLSLETNGVRAVVVDLGMARIPGKNTVACDIFVHVGHVVNGRPDYAADVRTLTLGSCYDMVMMCASGKPSLEERMLCYEVMAVYNNLFAGVCAPSKGGWFVDHYPSMCDAMEATIPDSVASRGGGSWLLAVANMCKLLAPRPYVKRACGKEKAHAMWRTLFTELGLTAKKSISKADMVDAVQRLRAIADRSEIPPASLMKAACAVGLLTASVAEACYEKVEEIKASHVGMLRWKDALDAWVRLPVKCSGSVPKLGSTVILHTESGTEETVVTQSMLRQIVKTREALGMAQAAFDAVWTNTADYEADDELMKGAHKESAEDFATFFLKGGTTGPIAKRCKLILKSL